MSPVAGKSAGEAVAYLTFNALRCSHRAGVPYRYRISGFEATGKDAVCFGKRTSMDLVFQSNTNEVAAQPDGVSVPSLLQVLIHRLESLQGTSEACEENHAALLLLRKGLYHANRVTRPEAANASDYEDSTHGGSMLLEAQLETAPCTG